MKKLRSSLLKTTDELHIEMVHNAVLTLLIGITAILVMRFVDLNFTATSIILLLSGLSIAALTLKTSTMWRKPERELYFRASTVLRVLAAFVVVGTIIPLTPLFATKATGDEIKPNTTYITYSDDCPYCKISHTNMKRAVSLYNATHTKQVSIVDIGSDTELADQLKQSVKKKGTVISYGSEAGVYDNYQEVYTLGHEDATPAKASADHIYDVIKRTVDTIK